MRNNFESFKTLPKSLQDEALREGEARIQAQFAAAGAADQRALTWGGFLIAAATAALGGGVALITKETPDFSLAILALLLAAALLRAAWLAISTALPVSFDFPGNSPSSWLPEAWACVGSDEDKIAQARTDQAQHLSEAITSNRLYADQNGQAMRKSFRWALISVSVGAFIFGALLIHRHLVIEEPNSLIRLVPMRGASR